MAWIELHQSLIHHRKTFDLADTLAISQAQAVGHMAALWCWALDNAPDGDVSAIKPATLARAALWTDGAATFVDALYAVGFLDADGRLHDWEEFAGRLIDRREANAARMRQARAQNVQRTCGARAGATVPNRTVPNSTVPNPPVIPPSGDAAAPPTPGEGASPTLQDLEAYTQAKFGSSLFGPMAQPKHVTRPIADVLARLVTLAADLGTPWQDLLATKLLIPDLAAAVERDVEAGKPVFRQVAKAIGFAVTDAEKRAGGKRAAEDRLRAGGGSDGTPAAPVAAPPLVYAGSIPERPVRPEYPPPDPSAAKRLRELRLAEREAGEVTA